MRLTFVLLLAVGGFGAASVSATPAGAATVPTLTGVVDGQAISGTSGLYAEEDLTKGGAISLFAVDGLIHVKRLVASADDCAGPGAVCELFSVSGTPTNIVGTPVELLDFAPRLPVIIPETAFVNPGDSGSTPMQIPILLSYASTHTVTVQWRTVAIPGAGPSQAVPATDYMPASGTLTFAPGVQQQNATVSVIGGVPVALGEYFVVQCGNPTNATMGGFWGLGFGAITQ
jgi:hypothetical protein